MMSVRLAIVAAVRRRTRSNAPLVTAAALFASVALAACGSSTATRTLNSAAVERSIATSILKQRSIYTTVSCPSRIPQKAGYVFSCSARLDVGAYPVSATEIDGDGHVRYSNTQPLLALNVTKVQRAIESSVYAQRHVRAVAKCPAEVIQRQGVLFDCSVTPAGSTGAYKFAVTETDGAGHVRYLGT